MERQKDRVIKILGAVVFIGLILVISWFLFYNTYNTNKNAGMEPVKEVEITLPPPQKTSETSIEEALLKRRSIWPERRLTRYL